MFLDEADCALDSHAAARVAAFLATGGLCTGTSKAYGSTTAIPGAGTLGKEESEGKPQADAQSRYRAAAGTTDAMVACDAADTCGVEAHRPPATQYIVVSHRPQVFERASRLVGVYSAAPGVSHAVSVCCPGRIL